jgi:glycosyltransferase involved in cell wall biosynthesis
VRLLYAFPEPLPLDRARGIQTIHTVAALARADMPVDLAYVPAGVNPFSHYAVGQPPTVSLFPVERSLPWPFARVHSNRIFSWRLARRFAGELDRGITMVRHLKLAAWLAACGSRFVYEAHEVFADTAPVRNASQRRAEEAAVMRGAAAVVANSGATARRLMELYGRRDFLEVIPNGVARPDRLPPKDWGRAQRHVVYAGSFFPWKGAADLVAAARSLPGARIELIGGEPEQLGRLAGGQPDVGAELVFTGRVPHAMVADRLASACIAVLPNRADPDSAFTSPIKLFEYMAAGCAIVASDLPALREILSEHEAVWCTPGDPASLAQGIALLAADPQLAQRLGDTVREKSKNFTWDARAARLRAVLERLGA